MQNVYVFMLHMHMCCVFIYVWALYAHMAISLLLAQPLLLGNDINNNSPSNSYGLEIFFFILLISVKSKGITDQNWVFFFHFN